MVGLLGNIRFRVSERGVLVPRNFKREISSTWNTMERIGMKPMVEYGGPNLQTVSMEIILDAALGVRPKSMLRKLEQMAESPECYDLVIGKRRVGKGMWTIVKCSQAYDILLRGGEIYKATVSLTLQEYV